MGEHFLTVRAHVKNSPAVVKCNQKPEIIAPDVGHYI